MNAHASTLRLRSLAHPAYLAALAALLLNDRVWKAAAPSVWTGKVSDFAGLVVLPVMLCAFAGVATRRRAWVVHLGVGALFAALQFVDLAAPLAALSAATGVLLAHTPDPTDLVALAVLPLGVALVRHPPRAPGRTLRVAGLALSVVAVAGTSKPPDLTQAPLFGEEGALLRHGREPDEVFRAVEVALTASGVEVHADTTWRQQTVRQEAHVDQQRFEVSFPYAFSASAFASPPADTVRTVAGWIVLSYDLDHGGTRLVEDGDFPSSARDVDRSALEAAVRRRVLEPIAAIDSTLSRI